MLLKRLLLPNVDYGLESPVACSNCAQNFSQVPTGTPAL